MEYISSKNIFLLMRDTLKLIDRRPMDHGSRTGYIMCKMLEQKGGYEGYELADFLMVATIHDIGVYKTDNISNMLTYEFREYMPHSVYGFLFLKYLSPLKDKAKMLLYHGVDYGKLQKTNYEFLVETGILGLAEMADVYHNTMGQSFDCKMFRKLENKKFSKEALDLLEQAEEKWHIFSNLRDESYQKELDAYLDYMIFNNEDKKAFMEMMMFCIGFGSEYSVVDCVTTTCIAGELASKMELDEESQNILYYASLLHDIGMLSVPKSIVDAPRKLTIEERKLISTHVEREKVILKNRLHESVVDVATAHHERCDGSGYPVGLKGIELNSMQKVLMIADTITGLVNKRSYREPKDKSQVIAILYEEVNKKHFDKKVVDVFVEGYDEIMAKVLKESEAILLTYARMRQNYELVSQNLKA